jgi:hypothetical protein
MHTFVGAIEDLKPGDHFSVIQLHPKGGAFSHYEVVLNNGGRMVARDSYMVPDVQIFDTIGYSMQIGGFRLTKRTESDRKA